MNITPEEREALLPAFLDQIDHFRIHTKAGRTHKIPMEHATTNERTTTLTWKGKTMAIARMEVVFKDGNSKPVPHVKAPVKHDDTIQVVWL